ncbi:heme NO-binding domain-containing protein [Lentibacter sp.]|uniref:heme NO-binding domain-containing protein n=1 Tax=Lentibacter sp. TaxID=2024994 RepID=UPI003F69A829
MKGVIFVELLRMAEAHAGEALVDEVLDGLTLASGGAYSGIGSYSCGELFSLVEAFSKRLDMPEPDLQKAFGHWMFSHFLENYGEFFADKKTAFDMLASIEGEVHVEVRKLYPDAELPKFETYQVSETEMTMIYKSARPLEFFCLGLIEACLVHYGTAGRITPQQRSGDDGAHMVFSIGLDAA